MKRLSRRARVGGYTLVELMVVLVVIGVMLGLVSLSLTDDRQARLRRDAERLETLFALAAEEAQLASRPIAWRATERGYGFYWRDQDRWVPMAGDAQFRERTWDVSPMRLTLAAGDVSRYATRSPYEADDGSTSIAFPRDGLQVAFALTLEADGKSVIVRADGAGRYWVDTPT